MVGCVTSLEMLSSYPPERTFPAGASRDFLFPVVSQGDFRLQALAIMCVDFTVAMFGVRRRLISMLVSRICNFLLVDLGVCGGADTLLGKRSSGVVC